MAASLAKECLSPVLKGGGSRRRSLDICQQLGSQLLSPSFNLQLQSSPSATQKSSTTGSHGNTPSSVPINKLCLSPFKTQDEEAKTSFSPVFSSTVLPKDIFVQNNGEDPTTNYLSKRRASDSFWLVDNPPGRMTSLLDEYTIGQDQQRKKSLTPGPYPKFSWLQKNNQKKVGWEERLRGSEGEVDEDLGEEKRDSDLPCKIACNVIPPTPVASSKTKGQSGLSEEAKRSAGSIKPCPLSLVDDDDGSESEGELDGGPSRSPALRRVSPGAKCDLDDSMLNLVALRWNLTLNPNDLLGKGSFGTVVSGKYGGEEVAVKVLKTTTAQRQASIEAEDNALNLPLHNHIARTLEIFQIGLDRALIVMEKMRKGNLLTLLNDPSYRIRCLDAINISKQIALALIFCHRQGILHLDVKPQNILVDTRNCFKLSDFGSSKKVCDLETGFKYSTLEGTIPYASPELFKGERPTEKCDVYGFAVTMWQILHRETPYENENQHSVIFRVVSQGLRPRVTKSVVGCPETSDEKKLKREYAQIYEHAWDAIPSKRPAMADIHKNLIKIQFSKI